MWASIDNQGSDLGDPEDFDNGQQGLDVGDGAVAVDSGAPVYDTEQEAAGHSELQIAFERAYERMLRKPPPSIVDTVLSEAWQPNAKKSAQWRKSFQSAVSRKTDWEVRNPAEEKKPYYDSLSDNNCRRVVENPKFRKMIMRTRPDSEFIFAQRVISEERNKPDRKKERRLKLMSRKSRAEPWDECVRRFMEAPPAQEAGAQAEGRGEQAGNAGAGGGGGGGADIGAGGQEGGVEQAWGVDDGGVNAEFNSLNAVLMNDGHRPAAFASLKKQLEEAWIVVRAPAADIKHIKRYTFLDASPTNLAHLFYQSSRWSQYRSQVQKTCELIYRREMLLTDLKDHLQVAGGHVDEALTHKLADFYAFSHEAIYHCNAVKALYPGATESAILLQDYIKKVRLDTVQVKMAAPKHVMPEGGEGGGQDGGDGQGGAQQVYREVQEHRVKLAAELVLESVQREAAAYAKMLAKAPVKSTF